MERFHLERDGSRIFIREAPLPFVNEEGFFPSLFLRAFESRSLLIDDRVGGFDGQVAVQVQGHAVLGHEVVGEQLTLTLDEHQAALLEAEAERLEDLAGLVRDLDSRFPRLFRDRKFVSGGNIGGRFLTWMQPTFPVLSILDATFTVFPHMS